MRNKSTRRSLSAYSSAQRSDAAEFENRIPPCTPFPRRDEETRAVLSKLPQKEYRAYVESISGFTRHWNSGSAEISPDVVRKVAPKGLCANIHVLYDFSCGCVRFVALSSSEVSESEQNVQRYALHVLDSLARASESSIVMFDGASPLRYAGSAFLRGDGGTTVEKTTKKGPRDENGRIIEDERERIESLSANSFLRRVRDAELLKYGVEERVRNFFTYDDRAVFDVVARKTDSEIRALASDGKRDFAIFVTKGLSSSESCYLNLPSDRNMALMYWMNNGRNVMSSKYGYVVSDMDIVNVRFDERGDIVVSLHECKKSGSEISRSQSIVYDVVLRLLGDGARNGARDVFGRGLVLDARHTEERFPNVFVVGKNGDITRSVFPGICKVNEPKVGKPKVDEPDEPKDTKEAYEERKELRELKRAALRKEWRTDNAKKRKLIREEHVRAVEEYLDALENGGAELEKPNLVVKKTRRRTREREKGLKSALRAARENVRPAPDLPTLEEAGEMKAEKETAKKEREEQKRGRCARAAARAEERFEKVTSSPTYELRS